MYIYKQLWGTAVGCEAMIRSPQGGCKERSTIREGVIFN